MKFFDLFRRKTKISTPDEEAIAAKELARIRENTWRDHHRGEQHADNEFVTRVTKAVAKIAQSEYNILVSTLRPLHSDPATERREAVERDREMIKTLQAEVVMLRDLLAPFIPAQNFDDTFAGYRSAVTILKKDAVEKHKIILEQRDKIVELRSRIDDLACKLPVLTESDNA